MSDTTMHYPAVTRFEVIDHRSTTPEERRGLVQNVLAADVRLSLQDDGRTLKVFLSDRTDGKTEREVAVEWVDGLANDLESLRSIIRRTPPWRLTGDEPS